MSVFIAKNNLIPAGARIGAAVSGGADSMAMVHALCALGYDICVLHFEHGIREGSSEADMRFVERYCAERNIPFYCTRADVPALAESGESIESAARRLRYAFFAETAREKGVDLIATAHHADDNAETFLLNLLRGGGITGLSGMRAKRLPNIIRPLLFAKRSEIEEYCAQNDIPFVTDETNLSDDYTRNYIRHEILPRMSRINPDCAEAINRTQELLRQEDDALSVYAEREFRNIAEVGQDRVSLRLDAFCELPVGMQNRLLRRAIAEIGSLNDIEKQHIDALRELALTGGTGRKFILPKKFSAFVSYNSLIIAQKTYKINRIEVCSLAPAGRTELADGGCITACAADRAEFGSGADLTQYFDGGSLAGAVVRTRRQGDTFRALGATGTKKLKDWLIDKKIPAEQRDAIPLVARGSEILWIVGYAVSEQSKVREESQYIIKLEYISKELTEEN